MELHVPPKLSDMLAELDGVGRGIAIWSYAFRQSCQTCWPSWTA